MSELVSMQKLLGATQGLKNAIQANTRRHIMSSTTGTSDSQTKYDLEFERIKAKYCQFAATFGVELDDFLNMLSQAIRDEQVKQEQEKQRLLEAAEERMQNEKRERLMEFEKSEIRTNSNPPETEDTLSSVDYASTSSVTSEPHHVEPEPEPEPVLLPGPANIEARQSYPVAVAEPVVKVYDNPKPSYPAKEPAKKTANKKTKTVAMGPMPRKTAKKTKKTKAVKLPKIASAPLKVVDNASVCSTQENKEEFVAEPYAYNADKVRWNFDDFGVCRSSTIIYIGNLPKHVKIGAIQLFVMKRAKVTMRQVEETKLKFGSRANYALVRFRSDVSMKRINAFIEEVNAKNNEFFEKSKRNGDEMMPSIRPQKQVSWKKRVSLKLNESFKYFESEQAMYDDPMARNSIFIRNFDILDKECHKKLTYALLDCGDLARDIRIRVDRFGDPYCLAKFVNIEDAIYCCNAGIMFGGRMLEMKYEKQ